MKKRKGVKIKKEEQNRHFCGGTTRLTKGYANFEGSFATHISNLLFWIALAGLYLMYRCHFKIAQLLSQSVVATLYIGIEGFKMAACT